MRVISFRHEQNAGNAAAIAGFLTQKPGICLTVSAPGLPERPDRAGQCHDQLLPDDPDQRLQRARNRRPAARRLRRDGPARVAKPLCKAAFRVLHAEDIGVGIARAIRAAVSGRPGGVYLDLPAKLLAQTMDAARRQEIADQGRRSGAAPDPCAGRGQARARPAQGRQASADPARQGRGLRAGRCRYPRAGRKDRHPLPADVHGQGPAARHPCAIGLGRALVCAGGGRRRDAGRRAAELAAVARQGQDLGCSRRTRSSSSRSTSRRPKSTATCAIAAPRDRRHRLLRVGAAGRHRFRTGPSRRPTGPARSPSARTRTWRRWPRRWTRTRRR